MENQTIKGYRQLSQVETDLINEIKAQGEAIESLTNKLRDHICDQFQTSFDNDDGDEDQRLTKAQPDKWLNAGITNIQQGLMALTRAVAQPTIF
ncbi:hypothetical protein KTH06_10305 [Acinetobacter ursingii]|uniref:Acb2/Tad1 domain-containing protein n=1 Tax=Acinetobacter ursingii TaxID=108980 RepID=UPI000F78A7CA|nr:hypothetical protein [Acinetobacter ursingii]MCU4306221.1 hypothetical protein [Acinetobacter ursingii]MCU4372306.1 hypothetical protein [Acinetobacter ursingii]RSO80066.1 hypothetical protein EA748_16420 [Acinetobacter ursingii]